MRISSLGENLTIGEIVRAARKSRNISQSTLAKDVGVSRNLIIRLETKNILPDADTIIRIAYRLGISPVVMFRGGKIQTVMPMCYPGKTVFDKDGNWQGGFGYISVSADVEFNSIDYFCVEADGRFFLVKHNHYNEKAPYYVYVDENDVIFCTGHYTETGFVGSVIDDVTDCSALVMV